MKRIRIFLLIVLLASGVTVYAWSPSNRQHRRHHRRCVRIPLDGGLLTVLGVAGVAYFLVRRKNKKKEQ